jgi:predicted transcriptional regulator
MWFIVRYGRWYELDGFVMRKIDRRWMVKKVRTDWEYKLSDHKQAVMTERVKGRRWRVPGGNTRRVPNIKLEVLKEREKREEYKVETNERLTEANERINEGNKWKVLAEVMTEAAKEVCGVCEMGVQSPWTIGYEDELNALNERVSVAVRLRNERVQLAGNRRRLRQRRDGRLMERLEREVAGAREEVKQARRALRRRLRRLEREWWENKIRECEEACATGRVGDMYKCLRKIGTRGCKAGASANICVNEFKEHFERVTCERYEEEPRVIERAVNGATDLRECERAKEANDRLNEVPEREEIVAAMNDMKESAPGEDGVRI